MENQSFVIVASLFIFAFLGHLVGDYVLQSTWMALTKSKKGWEGILACTIHVTIYTIAVCSALYLALQTTDWHVWLAVFIPHWIIDHWSLGDWWSHLIRGRTKEKLLETIGLEREFGFAFYAPVYIAIDNTWHFLFLLATIKIFIVH